MDSTSCLHVRWNWLELDAWRQPPAHREVPVEDYSRSANLGRCIRETVCHSIQLRLACRGAQECCKKASKIGVSAEQLSHSFNRIALSQCMVTHFLEAFLRSARE